MRVHLATLASLLLAGALLAGCGDDGGETATDPSGSDPSVSLTPVDDPSASASAKPVSVQKTCSELYQPPDQWMPRAIEFVHGSPSAETVADADVLIAGLSEVEGHSLPPLAEDIAIARVAVDTQRAALDSGSDGPNHQVFDDAVNRLARRCELYVG